MSQSVNSGRDLTDVGYTTVMRSSGEAGADRIRFAAASSLLPKEFAFVLCSSHSSGGVSPATLGINDLSP